MKILTPEEVDDIAGRHSGERLPSPDSNIKIADLITTIYSAWQEMKTYEPSNGYMIVCLSGGRYCEVNDPAIVEALKLREIYNEEVEEFNAGVEAFKAGKSIDDEPGDLKQDQWRVGYAFAAFDILKRKADALDRLERMEAVDIRYGRGRALIVIYRDHAKCFSSSTLLLAIESESQSQEEK